jgi:hypothetical protein
MLLSSCRDPSLRSGFREQAPSRSGFAGTHSRLLNASIWRQVSSFLVGLG